ncbi:hypothetical protein BU17DRAFT_93915 [Hysterangium stoloniferum]|nr:hypothetical protein BU17DRAFT_93915 [Hysterangium stoloniferum]
MSSRNTVTHGKVRTGSNQGVVAVQLGRRHRDIEDGSVGRVGKRFIKGNGLLDERQKVIEFRRAEIAKLPPETHRLTQYMHNSELPCSFESNIHGLDSDDWEDISHDQEFTVAQLQGLELSHEGGEFEHLFSNWKNPPSPQDWEIQLPLLFEAYMEFNYGGDRIMTDISDASDTAGDIRMEQAQDEFTITMFGLEGYAACTLAHDKRGHTFLNQTLISHGFLGASPIIPSLAFSLKDLEIYCHCRLRCPQFSIQQWVKVMCDLSNINYKPIYCTRDTPDWRIKHSCPPCLYQLADEPALSPSIIGAVDGNNSLKRFIKKTAAEDTLAFESDYFLSRDFVNQFAGEVKVIRRRRKGDKVQEVHEEGDPTDGDPTIVVCTDRWKVANADKTNVLLTSFNETGIFIGACRHGIIWIISDMVKSGELAKYPLATCAYLLKHLPHDIGIGYDIGCSFTTTLANSSLGVKARENSLKFVVPAFHGHAHNRSCQLSYHVGMCKGFGLEDCEVCERVFSGSNKIARCTRHSTIYHRKQFIDMYFHQWDLDKYENLATFLLNNYQQALKIISEMTMRQKMLTPEQVIPDTQFMKWLDEERAYLKSKASEPEKDILSIEYVTLLQAYDSARMVADQAGKMEREAKQPAAKIRLIRIVREAWEAVLVLQKEVQNMEEHLDISERWTITSAQYQDVLKYMDQREFQLAIDKLEGLVVQRLFELTKANVSETGYKMRVQIAKAIKTRSKAIQRALITYNDLAVKMIPPHPKLTWAEIVEYSTIAEFELLRIGAWEDIRNLEWAKAYNCEATRCHLKILRAKEEIQRLDIEVRRLATWIDDEIGLFSSTLEQLKHTDILLFGAVKEHALQQERVNNHIRLTLHKIYMLEGFSGNAEIGRKVDKLVLCIPGQELCTRMVEGEKSDCDYSSEDEELQHVDQLYKAMAQITLQDK